MISNLDKETRKGWDHNNTGTEPPTIEELMQYVTKADKDRDMNEIAPVWGLERENTKRKNPPRPRTNLSTAQTRSPQYPSPRHEARSPQYHSRTPPGCEARSTHYRPRTPPACKTQADDHHQRTSPDHTRAQTYSACVRHGRSSPESSHGSPNRYLKPGRQRHVKQSCPRSNV